MNKVILLGRLTKDPETRSTLNGKNRVQFTLAVNRTFKVEGQPQADFIPIVAWDKLADVCSRYLSKGSQVLVEGRLTVRSYTAQDGSTRYVTEVVASDIEFVGPKQNPSSAPYSQQAPEPASPMTDMGNTEAGDEEVPF